MRNIALILEYDGCLFHGWQSQKNAAAVQDIVAAAICRLDGPGAIPAPDASAAVSSACSAPDNAAHASASDNLILCRGRSTRRPAFDASAVSSARPPTRITGASRTDAGVHARGQVANFSTESSIPADKYAYALNTLLPAGVVCARSFEAPPDFHARFSAVSKTYSYLILNRRQPSALYRSRAWHVPLPLDMAAMQKAADLFIGERDFRAFMAAGSPVKSTVRTVTRLTLDAYPVSAIAGDAGVHSTSSPASFAATSAAASCSAAPDTATAADPDSGAFIQLLIEGNSFLYNMVRIIAGTLVYVGQGKMSHEDVRRAIEAGDRKLAGKTAPPHGLCLERVNYH